MKWDGIHLSPGPEASAATALAYSQMAELSSSLAKYIQMLGYEAIPSGNDTIVITSYSIHYTKLYDKKNHVENAFLVEKEPKECLKH